MISDSNNRRHLFRIAAGTAILALLLLAGGADATMAVHG